MRSKGTLLSLALSGLLLVGAGCAEERAPINRVQPGAMSKAFFVGEKLSDSSDDPEFYWRNYVVDGSASQSLLGVGSWGGVDRIRWEITEDMLIAHKAYQIAAGEDDKGIPTGEPNGTVVAAFAITSHFDIKRAYNPSTGEESNVVEENSTDVAPLKRKYMRVDWSKNLVDSPMWDDMFVGKLFGEITVSPASYDITDPASPDAPHFEPDQGYFDVTLKYDLMPEQSFIPGYPTCVLIGLYTGSTTYECDVQEATVRSSFQRIDAKADFEPLEITRAPLDVVGNPGGLDLGSLRVGMLSGIQQGWDPGYGFTDSLYHRFAHIHNLWKKSHQDASCDDNEDADHNGTADACENEVTGYDGNVGSQCDVAASKCTVPYRDRELKTVTYWVNDLMLPELQDTLDDKGNPVKMGAAEEIIASWNQLMSNAVAHSREVECRRTGGLREDCEAEFFQSEKAMLRYGGWLVDQAKEETPALAICHNPVRSYDRHEVCGETGATARLGDIRKNFMAYWPYESRAPWGGIGNWGGDPLSGEIHGASAMIMGRSVTYAAARQRDIIQVAIGDLSIEDVTSGVPAENYVKKLQNGDFAPALSKAEIDARVASIDSDHAVMTIAPQPIAGSTIEEKTENLQQLLDTATVDPLVHGNSQLELDALASPLKGGVYEAQIVDSHWMVNAAAMSPDTSAEGSIMDAVSPLRGMDPGSLRNVRHDLSTILETHGVCFNDEEAPIFGSVNLQGLARYYKAKYPDDQYDATARGEAIYNDLVVEAFKGIAIHEVGHSLGLLHNFASSWDAQNFHPQYWQLRTHEGTSTESCDGNPRTGDTVSAANDHCMGPRYLDPATDDEQGLADEARPGIDYFGQTSVMEYPEERFGETVGLGQYDAHAMKALYGRVLETFDDEAHGGFSDAGEKPFMPRLESQISDQDRIVRSSAPFQGQSFAKPTHYTEVAREMKTFDENRCREATDEEKEIAGFRLVHGKVCAPPPKDHAAWADFEDAPTQASQPTSLAASLKTRKGTPTGENRVRWFYRWGQANNSYVHTNPGDSGADPYEVTVNAGRKFEAVYPWAYFRRQDREYDYMSLPGAVANSTIERLRSFHWSAANRTAFYKTFTVDQYNEIANSDDWHKPELMAEHEMFTIFAKMLLMPEPGGYSMAGTPAGSTRPIYDLSTSAGSQFSLGAGDGRFIGEQFDSDPDGGGSWNYTHWIEHAGFGVEKTYATMALADARPTLSTISRENYLDGRDVRISFRSDMPSAVDRLIGGTLAEDWEAVSVYVPGGMASPTPELMDLTTTDAPSRPNGSRVLFPNIGYKQQLGMLIFANLYSRYGTDMQLANKLRVWVDGTTEQVNIPEAQQTRFYDPASGYTYIARLYGDEVIDGKSIDRGIASRMLQHANDLLGAAYEVQVDGQGAPVLDAFGLPTLLLDADGQPVVKDPAQVGALTKYIGLLDAARQIGHQLGYGPLGGGGGED